MNETADDKSPLTLLERWVAYTTQDVLRYPWLPPMLLALGIVIASQDWILSGEPVRWWWLALYGGLAFIFLERIGFKRLLNRRDAEIARRR